MNLYRFPVAGKLLAKFDVKLNEIGIQETARAILSHFNTKLQVENLTPELIEILKNKPAVIVANHPAEADIFVLIASLPPREDFHLIVNATFLHIAPNLDKYFIPVYVSHTLIREDKFNFRLRFFKKLHSAAPVLSPEEEHLKNIESLRFAAEKVREGGLVAMFPGAGKENGEWFPGIGHLIKQVGKPDAKIVMAHITGTSTFDYLRFIPGLSRILSSFKIVFAPPKEMGDYSNLEPKEIARKLEGEYRSWVNTN